MGEAGEVVGVGGAVMDSNRVIHSPGSITAHIVSAGTLEHLTAPAGEQYQVFLLKKEEKGSLRAKGVTAGRTARLTSIHRQRPDSQETICDARNNDWLLMLDSVYISFELRDGSEVVCLTDSQIF